MSVIDTGSVHDLAGRARHWLPNEAPVRRLRDALPSPSQREGAGGGVTLADLAALVADPGARRRRNRGSWASVQSVGSVLSAFSLGSALSVLSLGSVGSILSIGSSGSILSIGSAGSILSIGSAGSILSIGGAGTILNRKGDPDRPLAGPAVAPAVTGTADSAGSPETAEGAVGDGPAARLADD